MNPSMILSLVIVLAIFYFMLIRPENKRKKEAEQMRSNLKEGDEITTIGGIVGTVVNVKDDKFVVETGADQVRIEFMNWALSSNETANAAAKEAAKVAAPSEMPAKKKKLTYKEQKELEQIEKNLEKLAGEKAELESQLASGTLPFDRLQAASERIGAIMAETDEKEMRWLELTDGL